MINVLYVIWSLGLGGAEQVVISLARGLDKNKFRPFICCLNDEGRFADELKSQGIEVFTLNKIKGIDFSVVPKLVKIIRENNIQIVHTHLWGANFWGRFAARAARVPVVVTEHNVDVWKSPLHFMIDKFLFKRTDCFIAVSRTVQEFYAQHLHIPKEKIRVVYNGIEAKSSEAKPFEAKPFQARESVQGLASSFGIKEDEKVIAVIGRLVPQKGIDFFLNAFRKMLEDGRGKIEDGKNKIKVMIVGEGPERKVLELRVNELNELKDKVIFTGFRKDVQEILSITDILVLPSSREGLPMILLEAMAAGVIVVATRVGGTPELVEDGVNGFLVEYGDVEGLAKKIQQVLTMDDRRWTMDEKQENKKDLTIDHRPLTIDQIRDNAKKTVEEKFSLEKMIAEHEGIYLGLFNAD